MQSLHPYGDCDESNFDLDEAEMSTVPWTGEEKVFAESEATAPGKAPRTTDVRNPAWRDRFIAHKKTHYENFAAQFADCWGNKTVFNLARSNMQGLYDYCAAWLDLREEKQAFARAAQDVVPKSILVAMEQVNDFCNGFINVADKQPGTEIERVAFKRIFLPTAPGADKEYKSEFAKNMVSTCRSNQEFQALEKDAVRCIGFERDNCELGIRNTVSNRTRNLGTPIPPCSRNTTQ